MNKNLILIIILLIGIGVGGFFGGMKYGESEALKNLTPEKMREIFQQRRGQFFYSKSRSKAKGRIFVRSSYLKR
jgi:uncharacterized protein YneF (UPF0154 family)